METKEWGFSKCHRVLWQGKRLSKPPLTRNINQGLPLPRCPKSPVLSPQADTVCLFIFLFWSFSASRTAAPFAPQLSTLTLLSKYLNICEFSKCMHRESVFVKIWNHNSGTAPSWVGLHPEFNPTRQVQHLKPNQNDLLGYPDLWTTITELGRAPGITWSCDKGGREEKSATGLLIMVTHCFF